MPLILNIFLIVTWGNKRGNLLLLKGTPPQFFIIDSFKYIQKERKLANIVNDLIFKVCFTYYLQLAVIKKHLNL